MIFQKLKIIPKVKNNFVCCSCMCNTCGKLKPFLPIILS